jgi:hypothetical protein
MQNSNPLANHFRQIAIYLKLPSGGKYWAPNTINLTANGEVGVMPMTAKDEILLKTPDALMNGQGIVDVIQSCIPQIKNAWAIPTIDVDAILIAIRIATYGEEMSVDSVCPKCKTESRHGVNLNTMLLSIRSPDYKKTAIIDGLTFGFKPQNYTQSNKNSLNNFEEQKIIQLLNNEDIQAEVRKAQFDIHLNKIIENSINILAQSTEFIITEDGTEVRDINFIKDFYTNANNQVIKKIREKLTEITDSSSLKPVRVQCESCENQYDIGITFDYANFFEPLS